MERDALKRILKMAAIVIGGFLFLWALFEYAFPSHASWRSICDEGVTTYMTQMSCDKNSCSSTIVPVYTCTKSHFECIKGRDGSTICSSPKGW